MPYPFVNARSNTAAKGEHERDNREMHANAPAVPFRLACADLRRVVNLLICTTLAVCVQVEGSRGDLEVGLRRVGAAGG